jgi:hypothetical protein
VIEQRETPSDPAGSARIKLLWVSHINYPDRLAPPPHNAGSQFNRRRILTLARLAFDVGITHILKQFSVFSFQFSVFSFQPYDEYPLAEN